MGPRGLLCGVLLCRMGTHARSIGVSHCQVAGHRWAGDGGGGGGGGAAVGRGARGVGPGIGREGRDGGGAVCSAGGGVLGHVWGAEGGEGVWVMCGALREVRGSRCERSVLVHLISFHMATYDAHIHALCRVTPSHLHTHRIPSPHIPRPPLLTRRSSSPACPATSTPSLPPKCAWRGAPGAAASASADRACKRA